MELKTIDRQQMKAKFLVFATIIALCACSNSKSKLPIYGEWQMVDWNGEEPALDISLSFKQNGEYYDSRSEDATWNYRYIAPDSLILFHHGCYEERYKILKVANDTLIIRMSESIFHTEDDGKEVLASYGDSNNQRFIFIRKK